MLIDEPLLDEVIGALDATTFQAVLGLFRAQSLNLAAVALDPALSLPERAEAAHAFKGLALQFGLSDLCAALSDLEAALVADEVAAINNHTKSLPAQIDATKAALDAYLSAKGHL